MDGALGRLVARGRGGVLAACAVSAPATPSRPPPTQAPTLTAAPVQAEATPTAPASPAPASDWQRVGAAGVELRYPPGWERLEPGAASPPVAVLLADSSGEAEVSLRCLSRFSFSETFGGLPSSPSAAGEALWDLMWTHFESVGQEDSVVVERLAEFELGGQPAVQVLFVAPGLRRPLGLENPIELDRPDALFYKSLTLVTSAEQVCYFVVTAVSENARGQPEVEAILASLRWAP